MLEILAKFELSNYTSEEAFSFLLQDFINKDCELIRPQYFPEKCMLSFDIDWWSILWNTLTSCFAGG